MPAAVRVSGSAIDRRLRIEQKRHHVANLVGRQDAGVAEARHQGTGLERVRIPDPYPGLPQCIRGASVALPIVEERWADRAKGDLGAGQLVACVAVAAAWRIGLVAEL